MNGFDTDRMVRAQAKRDRREHRDYWNEQYRLLGIRHSNYLNKAQVQQACDDIEQATGIRPNKVIFGGDPLR